MTVRWWKSMVKLISTMVRLDSTILTVRWRISSVRWWHGESSTLQRTFTMVLSRFTIVLSTFTIILSRFTIVLSNFTIVLSRFAFFFLFSETNGTLYYIIWHKGASCHLILEILGTYIVKGLNGLLPKIMYYFLSPSYINPIHYILYTVHVVLFWVLYISPADE